MTSNYETTARGDVWTTFEATSSKEAAIKQAQAWTDLGYKSPFYIFVSKEGEENARLYEVKPEGWVANEIPSWG